MYPGGQLLTFGYLREIQETLNLSIPRDVASITTEFVDMCLSTWSTEVVDECFKKEGDLSVNSKQWMRLTDLDLRVIQDQILFRHSNMYDRFGIVYIHGFSSSSSSSSSQAKKAKARMALSRLREEVGGLSSVYLYPSVKERGIPKDINTIVCECQFGMKGMAWLSSIVAHSKYLVHLTLSNNRLNDQCIQLLVNALVQNPSKTLTWLDISDNRQVTDESTKILIEKVLPCYVLTGFNLNATGITDQSCDYLLDFYRQESNASRLSKLTLLKMDDNPTLTETKVNEMRTFFQGDNFQLII